MKRLKRPPSRAEKWPSASNRSWTPQKSTQAMTDVSALVEKDGGAHV